jgi:hypothetical protein
MEYNTINDTLFTFLNDVLYAIKNKMLNFIQGTGEDTGRILYQYFYCEYLDFAIDDDLENNKYSLIIDNQTYEIDYNNSHKIVELLEEIMDLLVKNLQGKELISENEILKNSILKRNLKLQKLIKIQDNTRIEESINIREARLKKGE